MNEEVAAKVYGLGEGEGEARWWLGGLATIKATSKETDGLYTLVEVLEPEGEAPLHVHHREDEAFWVLDGEVTFRIGDETIEASAGSFVFGPRDVPHTFTVHSGSARLLFLLSPGGFEEFIYASPFCGFAQLALASAARAARRRCHIFCERSPEGSGLHPERSPHF